MLEFAEMLKVRRKTRWCRKERSFLAISGIPTILHVQVRGAPDQNSFRCATCESFGAVATCIPTFVACDGSLSRTLKAMICDLGMSTVIGTIVMIVCSGKQYEHCGVSLLTTPRNDALLKCCGVRSSNLVWHSKAPGLTWASNTTLQFCPGWYGETLRWKAAGRQLGMHDIVPCLSSKSVSVQCHLMRLGSLIMSQHGIGSASWRFSVPGLNFSGTQRMNLLWTLPAWSRETWFSYIVQLFWSCTSSGSKRRITYGFLCKQNFLAAVLLNLRMLKSGCWDLCGTRSCFAAQWPKVWVVLCEIESCFHRMQSTLDWLSVSASLQLVLSTLLLLWSVYTVCRAPLCIMHIRHLMSGWNDEEQQECSSSGTSGPSTSRNALPRTKR